MIVTKSSGLLRGGEHALLSQLGIAIHVRPSKHSSLHRDYCLETASEISDKAGNVLLVIFAAEYVPGRGRNITSIVLAENCEKKLHELDLFLHLGFVSWERLVVTDSRGMLSWTVVSVVWGARHEGWIGGGFLSDSFVRPSLSRGLARRRSAWD